MMAVICRMDRNHPHSNNYNHQQNQGSDYFEAFPQRIGASLQHARGIPRGKETATKMLETYIAQLGKFPQVRGAFLADVGESTAYLGQAPATQRRTRVGWGSARVRWGSAGKIGGDLWNIRMFFLNKSRKLFIVSLYL